MKNIRDFLSENFQFLEVKFSTYLNRHVFVMQFCFLFLRHLKQTNIGCICAETKDTLVASPVVKIQLKYRKYLNSLFFLFIFFYSYESN